MTRRGSSLGVAAVAFIAVTCVGGAAAAPARAINPLKPICGVAGLVSGIAGKACKAAQNGGRLLSAGKQLLSGHPGAALKTALGATNISGQVATRALGLAGLGAWVLGGARFALHQTATVLGQSTSPQLRSTWFSTTYWRMAAISALLTLPFLFAAAIQAVIRSDLPLLLSAAFGYLPLAMLAVAIAAPLTMLLLAAADELSRVVSLAAGNASGHFLDRAAGAIGTATLLSTSPFVAVVIGAFTVAGALILWIELLIREAAVYVIVLMLPLAFAALVWPARRVWATRAVEVLVALILSKFAIVAVLSLGGAAMQASINRLSLGTLLAGLVLVVLGAFAPWALIRLVPLAELAAGAAGALRGDATRSLRRPAHEARAAGHGAENWAASTTAQMRRDAQETPAAPAPESPLPDRATGAAATAAAAERVREAASGGHAANGSGSGSGNASGSPSGSGSDAGEASGAATSAVPPATATATATEERGNPSEPATGSIPELGPTMQDSVAVLTLGPPPNGGAKRSTDPSADDPTPPAPRSSADPPAEDSDPRPPAPEPDGGPL